MTTRLDDFKGNGIDQNRSVVNKLANSKPFLLIISDKISGQCCLVSISQLKE